MRGSSRAKATPSAGKAIDDLAVAVSGMSFTRATLELTARRTSPPCDALVP